ncbi:MAG: hypothetical protein RL338_45 [Chloroflexota bacterium]|jgi:plastocyanin
MSAPRPVRTAISIALPLVLALSLGACVAEAEPGWTYAPPPPATPTPSPAPSEAPTAAPTAAPSGSPSEPAEGDLALVALNIQFDKTELSTAADTPFTITLDNQDAGIPHNVEIRDAGGASLFLGEIYNGVETRTYEIPALAAGSYTFICTVHPNMVGTLTVG